MCKFEIRTQSKNFPRVTRLTEAIKIMTNEQQLKNQPVKYEFCAAHVRDPA